MFTVMTVVSKRNSCLKTDLNLIESKIVFTLSGYGRLRGSIVILLANNNNVIEIPPVCHLKYKVFLFNFKVLPERPQNLSCIQKGEHGTVACTWDRGQDTHLYTAYTLQWVRGCFCRGFFFFFPVRGHLEKSNSSTFTKEKKQ